MVVVSSVTLAYNSVIYAMINQSVFRLVLVVNALKFEYKKTQCVTGV